MSVVAILLLLLMVTPSVLAGPAEDEAAVWQLEEDYWKYVKEQDLDGYRTLWDERFVGWPSFSAETMGKQNIADWIPPLHEDSAKVLDIELKRQAVRSFGDIVVAHYLVKTFQRDASTREIVEESDWSRITHTWQRRAGTWQIVTGMSASYDH